MPLLFGAACENAISSAETERKQAEMRLKSAQAELKEKEQSSKSHSQAYSKDKAAHESMLKEIARIEVCKYTNHLIGQNVCCGDVYYSIHASIRTTACQSVQYCT